MMEASKPVMVAETWMESEASVIKSLLESYQIPCHYSNELPRSIYPFKDVVRGIRIYVPASLADEAGRLLEQHRRLHDHLRLVDDLAAGELPVAPTLDGLDDNSEEKKPKRARPLSLVILCVFERVKRSGTVPSAERILRKIRGL